ncbi:hypothetical protein [Sphingosinicella sp. CPCC 101087]|uniref:hypothetical protein n=1 Tax=Sphingosinicella sp. CPCC 101087 TaxID=2497754 RepID=UPI00101DBE56|nr:hypothetical protein [Sphingosinicella sp. CPCC 101087]
MHSPLLPQLRFLRATFTVGLLTCSFLLGACSDVRGELPEKVEVTEVIASSSTGVFMEGCATVVYRLDPATADTLMQQGAGFFRDIEPPRNENPRNPYSEWMETPLPDARLNHIHAVRAIGGCEGDGGDFRAREIELALRAPGSFYALTRNKEGMILVVPRSRLAAFLYVG